MLPFKLEQIHAYRGDTFVKRLRLNHNGQPVNLSEWVSWQAHLDTGFGTSVRFTLGLDAITGGELVLALNAEQTALLEPGVYRFDVQAERAGVVKTFIRGSVRVFDDVTKGGD